MDARRRQARGWLVMLLVGLIGFEVRAQADPFESLPPEQVERVLVIIELAREAEREGRWSDALGAWEALLAIVPAEEYRFRMAVCLEQLGRVEEALELQQALARSERGEIRQAAATRIAVLEAQRPPSLEVSATPEAATSEVGDQTRTTVATSAPDIEPEDGPSRVLPLVLGGASLLATGTGLVLGAMAQARAEEERSYDRSAPGAERRAIDALVEEAGDLSTAANVSLAVAGALAVGAVVSWLLGGTEDEVAEPAQVQTGWAPDGVFVRFAF